MAELTIENLRLLLPEETDADSPITENLKHQERRNFEALLMMAFGHEDTGSATSDPPNDTTGILTDSAASWETDEHNDRSIIFTSGNCKHQYFYIIDTTATTLTIGDNLYQTAINLYDAGVRSGDTYRIAYQLNPYPGHNHNGVNSEGVTLASGVVESSMLKTSYSDAVGAGIFANNVSISGGQYCFYPQIKETSGSVTGARVWIGADFINTALTTTVYIQAASGQTVTARFRYVTSSGEVHFLFTLRDYETGQIIAQTSAPDHPCFGNGGKPALVPHPFPFVFEDTGAFYQWRIDPETMQPTNQGQRVEIIAAVLKRNEILKVETNCIVEDELLPDKDFLESFNELYELDEIATGDWPDIPITVGLPKFDEEGNIVDDYRFARKNTHIKPIQKVIVKPNMVEIAKIKNRSPVV